MLPAGVTTPVRLGARHRNPVSRVRAFSDCESTTGGIHVSTTTPPPDGSGPEYLEQGGGDRVPPGSGSGTGRRTALVAGGAVAALAAAAVGTWAAISFLGGGAEPAEALPAGTLGYASVDLDPSGAQKIEAFRMLNKFPAFKEEFGIDAADDVRKQVVEESLAGCESIDFAQDVEPWLGTSFAVAAVDTGAEQPSAVVVLEVTDAEAAGDGLAALKECGDGEEGGWSIEGDWAVVAETDEIAQQVTDAAAEGTLADDAEYQEWMQATGDPGVVTMYAAPEAGPFLAQLMTEQMMGASSGGAATGAAEPAVATVSPEVPEELEKSLEDFPGAAATVRFNDGAVELEVVGGATRSPVFDTGAEGVDVVTSLPDDTAVAFGLAFADGWGQRLADQMSSMSGGQMTGDDILAQAEQMTGLSLPEDLETLLGDSMAIALSSDFTVEDAMNSADGSDVPVGIKVQGDAAGIQQVLDRLTARLGPGAEQMLGSDAEGDTVAVGPNPDYRSALLADGRLGDTATFEAVVPEADSAPFVVFVNFDGGQWLTSVAEGDPAAVENLEPLEAFGASVWQDDDTTHALVKLTTN